MLKPLRLFVLISVIAFAPALADSVDVGFVNGTQKSVVVVLEYDTGTQHVMHLETDEVVLARGIPSEVLTRIHIRRNGRKEEVLHAGTIRATAKYRGAPWLIISGASSTVITPQEAVRFAQKSRDKAKLK